MKANNEDPTRGMQAQSWREQLQVSIVVPASDRIQDLIQAHNSRGP